MRKYLYFFGSILAITIWNILFRDYLYAKSLDIILDIQNSGRTSWVNTYFRSFKLIGDAKFVYIVLVLIYIFGSRALAFHYTLIISHAMFFLVFMKMLIHYPRPYQYHPDIIPVSCSGQFGCPSATSIRIATMIMSLYLDFVHEKRR